MWSFPRHLGFTDRDISWLSFNERVLQEAQDPMVPLLERLRFLGIFSSNLDEFFRVRVAAIRRDVAMGIRPIHPNQKPDRVLADIQEIVKQQQLVFDATFESLLLALSDEGISLKSDQDLDDAQRDFVRYFFHHQLRPALLPIMLSQVAIFPELEDHNIYQAIRLCKKKRVEYALVQLPTATMSRFLELPSTQGRRDVILIEDVIRGLLGDLFNGFGFDQLSGYTIKVTRDAGLDLELDHMHSYVKSLEKGLIQRRHGQPVRFIYEQKMPADMVHFFTKKLGLTKSDTILPLRRRYHNFKDFIHFPTHRPELRYPTHTPRLHPRLAHAPRLLDVIAKRDVGLHYPAHSFSHVLDLLREAAIDPKVTTIKMTLYRLAKNSQVVNALLNAVRNGKDVTVVIELQARFDEAANIHWTKLLSDEGVRIVTGIPSLKVHAKLGLIERREHGKCVQYAILSTGNFNESTATLYTDHTLLTADRRLTLDVSRLFQFLENPTRFKPCKTVWVSPFGLRTMILKALNYEIASAKRGLPARCIMKMNALTDPKVIAKLMEAAAAGVQVDLIIRGMCSLVTQPGLPIRVVSIVDRFLEHSRMMWWHHGGEPLLYLSSSDWMTRSFDRRIEVAFPILDPTFQASLLKGLDTQLADNVKARDVTQFNQRVASDGPMVRSQEAIMSWLHDHDA